MWRVLLVPISGFPLARFICSEGGLFRAELSFPSDFPNNPPVMKFLSNMWHPNSIRSFNCSCLVYEDGSVCISILHSPGVDMFNEFVPFILPVVSHRNHGKRGGDPFFRWRPSSSVYRTCCQNRTRTPLRISTLPSVLCLLFMRRSSTARIGNNSRSVSGERCRIRWKRSDCVLYPLSVLLPTTLAPFSCDHVPT